MSLIDEFPKRLLDGGKYGSPDVTWNHAFNIRGAIALHIIEANSTALIAGDVDGEDSTGRSKERLQSPREVVLRALEIGDIFVTECEARGWIKDLSELDGRK